MMIRSTRPARELLAPLTIVRAVWRRRRHHNDSGSAPVRLAEHTNGHKAESRHSRALRSRVCFVRYALCLITPRRPCWQAVDTNRPALYQICQSSKVQCGAAIPASAAASVAVRVARSIAYAEAVSPSCEPPDGDRHVECTIGRRGRDTGSCAMRSLRPIRHARPFVGRAVLAARMRARSVAGHRDCPAPRWP